MISKHDRGARRKIEVEFVSRSELSDKVSVKLTSPQWKIARSHNLGRGYLVDDGRLQVSLINGIVHSQFEVATVRTEVLSIVLGQKLAEKRWALPVQRVNVIR